MTRYTDPGILPRVEVYAERRMLKAAEPVTVLQIAADEHALPKNRSDTIVLRRPVPLEPVTTPLLEGATPDITPFRFEDVRGTLQQFGQVTQISDKVQIMHEDPVLMKMVEQLGKNVGRTNERLMWGELRAGTNVFYSNGSTRSAVNTAPTLDMVQNVVQELETQHAEPFSKVLRGSVLINTSPIEESYIAFCHTHLMHDIRAMAGFVPVSQYGTMQKVHARELGATENCRWVRSPDLPPFYSAGGSPGSTVRSSDGASADVYPILICGMNAYACVPLRGFGSMEPKIIPPSMRSKSDPLEQRGYAATKWWFLCMITNELWMARLEVAASKLA